MGEPALALVELIVICLLICLVYAKKKKPNSQLFDSASVDYAVTIWAEQQSESAHGASDAEVMPQRITAEYLVRIKAESDEALAEAQQDFSRRASVDFHSRFVSVLGDCNIGAVLCQPAEDRE